MVDSKNTETPLDENMFKGSNGRLYKTHEDGRVTEVFDPVGHAKRQLAELDSNSNIGGVRITDPKNPEAPAVVVTFEEAESKLVLKTIKEILTARTK